MYVHSIKYTVYTKYDYDCCDKITLAHSTQTHRYRAKWTQWQRINSEFHVRQIVLDVIAIYFISFNYMLLFMYGGVRVDSEVNLGQMSSRFPPVQWISEFIMILVIFNEINCPVWIPTHHIHTITMIIVRNADPWIDSRTKIAKYFPNGRFLRTATANGKWENIQFRSTFRIKSAEFSETKTE